MASSPCRFSTTRSFLNRKILSGRDLTAKFRDNIGRNYIIRTLMSVILTVLLKSVICKTGAGGQTDWRIDEHAPIVGRQSANVSRSSHRKINNTTLCQQQTIHARGECSTVVRRARAHVECTSLTHDSSLQLAVAFFCAMH